VRAVLIDCESIFFSFFLPLIILFRRRSANYDNTIVATRDVTRGDCLMDGKIEGAGLYKFTVPGTGGKDQHEVVNFDTGGMCVENTQANMYVYKEFPLHLEYEGSGQWPGISALTKIELAQCSTEIGGEGGDFCQLAGGVDLTVGYGNIDGRFDWEEKSDSYAGWCYRNAAEGVLFHNYMAGGSWAGQTDDGGTYFNFECGEIGDVHGEMWDGFETLWNECIYPGLATPNPQEVSCPNPGLVSVAMGRKFSHGGE